MTEPSTPPEPKPMQRPTFAGEVGPGLASRNWGWFLFRGLLALGLGILAILFPFSAITAFAMLFAIFAFVDGVSMLVSGIVGASNHAERWWGLVIAGLAGIAVGAIYFLWPALSTFAYAVVLLAIIAVWAIVNGVAQIAAAVRLRREIKGEWLLALSGLLSIILGGAILFVTAVVPGASILSVGWIIGFYALFVSAALIALAIRLRMRGRGA